MPADWILANENWKCRYQPVVYPQTGDDPGMRVGAIYAAALYVAMLQATLTRTLTLTLNPTLTLTQTPTQP